MNAPIDPQKFQDPRITAKGERRAQVFFKRLDTLWINTGSQCNIECLNCYIQSSPTADHFIYFTPEDFAPFLAEIDAMDIGPIEIGFTGGEPYLNPHMNRLTEMALAAGHRVMILTNAMKPMMRPRVQAGLLELQERFPAQITLRVSLDHFAADGHDQERGAGSFAIAKKGLSWLSKNGFDIHIAGRAMFSEDAVDARGGYISLFQAEGWQIDTDNAAALILFPEMDEAVDVPEITVACWSILDVHPDAMMCSNARMVVRRKCEPKPAVLACTLLWDDPQFEMGKTLRESLSPVALNHPHCAKFCVLGGASCSG